MVAVLFIGMMMANRITAHGRSETTTGDDSTGIPTAYRQMVVKSVYAMNLVLDVAVESSSIGDDFDNAARLRSSQDDAWQYHQENGFGQLEYEAEAERSPRHTSQAIQLMLSRSLPLHEKVYSQSLIRHSRPSTIVRLWLPGIALLVSVLQTQ